MSPPQSSLPGSQGAEAAAAAAFESALASYLDHDAPIDSAINDFVQPINALYDGSKPTEDQLESVGWMLGYTIINRARATPHDSPQQDRLITFLQHLKAAPPPSHEPAQLWGHSFWTDLPLLGPAMREQWNDEADAGVAQWVNLNAFTARLSSSGTADFEVYAIWSIRDALEASAEQHSITALEIHVQAAIIWIRYAGKFIYSSERIWEQHRLRGDPAVGGPLWKGKSGFCKERWALWKDRLTELSEEQKISNEVRGMVREAAETMTQIESG